MSRNTAPTDYSIDGDDDDLRAEFDEEFDWEDPDEYRASTSYCDECGGGGTGSLDLCCV